MVDRSVLVQATSGLLVCLATPALEESLQSAGLCPVTAAVWPPLARGRPLRQSDLLTTTGTACTVCYCTILQPWAGLRSLPWLAGLDQKDLKLESAME